MYQATAGREQKYRKCPTHCRNHFFSFQSAFEKYQTSQFFPFFWEKAGNDPIIYLQKITALRLRSSLCKQPLFVIKTNFRINDFSRYKHKLKQSSCHSSAHNILRYLYDHYYWVIDHYQPEQRCHSVDAAALPFIPAHLTQAAASMCVHHCNPPFLTAALCWAGRRREREMTCRHHFSSHLSLNLSLKPFKSELKPELSHLSLN